MHHTLHFVFGCTNQNRKKSILYQTPDKIVTILKKTQQIIIKCEICFIQLFTLV